MQYWDKGQIVAHELGRQLALPHSPQPGCCESNGTLWDLAALYPKGVRWGDSAPLFADGTVVTAAPRLKAQVDRMAYVGD